MTIEAGQRVIMANYSHEYGEDTRIFMSDDGAEKWRQEIAQEWWEREMDDEPKPEDPGAAADAYFNKMSDINAEEFFTTESVEVEP